MRRVAAARETTARSGSHRPRCRSARALRAPRRRQRRRRRRPPRSKLHDITGRFCSGSFRGSAIRMVLPLIWTENCAAPITVARMPWPGSQTGGRSRRCASAWRSASARSWPRSPKRARLALVEIFGDAAGKRHGVDAPVGERGGPGLGHQQAARQLARLPQIDHAHDEARHALGDALAVRRRQRLAERQLDAERVGDLCGRRLDPREAVLARLRRSGARRPRWRQVARMRPFSIRANLVVPPPMSTLSRVAPWPRDSATAPEPWAASWHSMWWPAEAQTNLPASSENRSAMARALRRLIASPVRMTAPLSTSRVRSPHRRSSRR